MHESSIAHWVVRILLVALPSCSLLVHTNERQCKVDLDCVDAMLGARCVNQVCVAAPECQGPTCGVSSSPNEQGPCKNDMQCTSDTTPRCLKSTCVSREVGERWVCTADDQSIKTNTVRFGFHIVDFLSRQPPANIVVKACRSNDVACTEPVATFKDTDGTGHAQFELPSGFMGYFDITSDSLPALLYVTKPIVKHTLSRDLPMVTAETIQLFGAVANLTIDSTKGLVLLEALDCSDTPAGGIQFTMQGMGDSFYLVDQLPSRDAKMSMYDAVNNSANGGFANVPPGFVTFGARLGVDGLELGTAYVRVRGNAINFVEMHF